MIFGEVNDLDLLAKVIILQCDDKYFNVAPNVQEVPLGSGEYL